MNKNKWYTMSASEDGSQAEILIYDEIGFWGVTAKDFREELKELGDVGEINLRINSPGGSVIDGFAIYNTLKGHPAKVTAHIDGWAASMASIIAMSADEITMPENTWMVIHNPWTVALGDAEDLRKSANILEAMKNDAVNAYQSHAKDLSRDDISGHMDEEKWMNGADAVSLGYADNLISDLEVAASLTVSPTMFKNAPKDAMEWVAEQEEEKVEDATTENSETTTDEPSEEVAESAPETEVEEIETDDDQEQEVTEVEPVGEQTDLYKNAVAVGRAEQLIEQTAMRRDLESQIKTLQEYNKDNEALVEELRMRLNKLLPGMSATDIESGPETFAEAKDLCDGDYAAPREKYPH